MVLFIYVKLNSFAKVTPPSMKQTNMLVKQFDLDDNGTLDKEVCVGTLALACGSVVLPISHLVQPHVPLPLTPPLNISGVLAAGCHALSQRHDARNHANFDRYGWRTSLR
jgi:hypothetical protein